MTHDEVHAYLNKIVEQDARTKSKQNEEMNRVLSELRTCVRTHASAAHASGLEASSDAFSYFIRFCEPPASDFDLVGVILPGIIRKTVNDEWAAILNETRQR